jgi:flagellar assembly protein FliH
MKLTRPHRFPPLVQLVARPNEVAEGALAVADGFQQGMDKGYEEGRQAGLCKGREEGWAVGHAEGLTQGRQDARAVFENLARPLDAAVQGLQRLQNDFQAAMRKEVVDLVAKVARRVILSELALQPLQLLNMVDETLASLPRVRNEEVEVYLNAEELQRIQELDPERAGRWNLLPDPRLEPGECHVKAGKHEADAGCHQRQAAVMEQISTQLIEPESSTPVVGNAA